MADVLTQEQRHRCMSNKEQEYKARIISENILVQPWLSI